MIHLHQYEFGNDTKAHSKKKLIENLSHYLGKNQNEINIQNNENGKPYVSDIFFSVSHCKDKVVQIFSFSDEVGVDIEFRNSNRRYLNLAKRYFHKFEYNQLTTIPAQDSLKLFYNLWTVKEAVCKTNGGRLWYYLANNYLSNDMKIAPQTHGINVKCLNQITDFSLCIASKNQIELKNHG